MRSLFGTTLLVMATIPVAGCASTDELREQKQNQIDAARSAAIEHQKATDDLVLRGDHDPVQRAAWEMRADDARARAARHETELEQIDDDNPTPGQRVTSGFFGFIGKLYFEMFKGIVKSATEQDRIDEAEP